MLIFILVLVIKESSLFVYENNIIFTLGNKIHFLCKFRLYKYVNFFLYILSSYVKNIILFLYNF